ncbi:hypothetical protein AB1Y20_009631 [Prymnesium parvum]|uniref:Dynamin GTPase n=1 Tax=Prymnesium parvum TaxID=97485 RepID=A0AB34K2N6_PRYPA
MGRWLSKNGRRRSSQEAEQPTDAVAIYVPKPEPAAAASPPPPPLRTAPDPRAALDRGPAAWLLPRKLQALEEVRGLLGRLGVEDVPGIVVLGAQNSGKSSLLESISGISFPRAEGMCTCCPTIVSLEVQAGCEPSVLLASDAEYTRNRRALPFVSAADRRAVHAEIARLMHLATRDGAVTDQPIYVRVLRPSGVTMTMCDLPGITAMSATQPDVEEATTALTAQWAANKRMILLCCVAACDDFHNSKALKLALLHDPRGERTIGVVTKCDTLPPRGDFLAKVRMERAADVKLQTHGFVAVRNRTQEESEGGASDDELRAAERALFTSHPQLCQLPDEMWGIDTLVAKLHALQARQLDEAMPPLCAALRSQLALTEREVDALPAALETAEQRRWRLLEMVQACSLQLGELISATDTSAERGLHLAARSHDLCRAFVGRVEQRLPNFLADAELHGLAAQVMETRGVYLPNLLHGSVFRRVIKQTAEAPLRESAVLLVEELAGTVKAALTAVLASIASDHPSLHDRLVTLAHSIVDEEREAALALVHETVDAEMCAPFTLNREYEQLLAQFEELVGGAGGAAAHALFPAEFIRAAADDIQQRSEAAGAERAMTRRLQASLHAYQHVLQARLFDSIPIAVRHRVMFRLHTRLAPTLLRDEALLLPLLGQEKPEVVALRNAAKGKLVTLRTALEKLEQVLSDDFFRASIGGSPSPCFSPAPAFDSPTRWEQKSAPRTSFASSAACSPERHSSVERIRDSVVDHGRGVASAVF